MTVEFRTIRVVVQTIIDSRVRRQEPAQSEEDLCNLE